MDEQWLTRLINNDQQAWQKFSQSYSASITRTVTKNMVNGRPEEVEDCVQLIFEKLCQNDYARLRQYQPERGKFDAWLQVLVRNATIDYLRKRELPVVTMDANELPQTDICAQSDMQQSISLPARVLSAREEMVMHLLFDRDYTTRQCAQALSLDSSTVRTLKARAIQKLKQHFIQD